jgi:hypothetical protein
MAETTRGSIPPFALAFKEDAFLGILGLLLEIRCIL